MIDTGEMLEIPSHKLKYVSSSVWNLFAQFSSRG